MARVKNYFIYKDQMVSQHPDVYSFYMKLFQELQPQQIVEIGTQHGGFTLILRDALDAVGLNHTLIKTYDIFKPHELTRILPHPGIEFKAMNIFNPANDHELKNVISFIQQPGCSMVFCDGGDKVNEFIELAPHLKEDDIILAHDYAPDYNYFIYNMLDKVWNWLEITDAEIEYTCTKNGLLPFRQEQFTKIAWCSRIKQQYEDNN